MKIFKILLSVTVYFTLGLIGIFLLTNIVPIDSTSYWYGILILIVVVGVFFLGSKIIKSLLDKYAE